MGELRPYGKRGLFGLWRHTGPDTSFSPYTPPTDTVWLKNTIAGGGADNTVILGNWLQPTLNATQANNATSWDGVVNGSNTVTGAAATGSHESGSALIPNTAPGWSQFGGAFKKSAGNALFVSLWCSSNAANYSTFDLTLGTVVSDAGTSVGTIHQLDAGGTWFWCSIALGVAQPNFATARFNWADTAVNSHPTGAFTSTTGDILLAGPWACVA